MNSKLKEAYAFPTKQRISPSKYLLIKLIRNLL